MITPYVWVHPEGDRRDGPRIGNLAHSFCTVGSMPKYYFESSAQRHRGGVLALLLWRRIAVRLLRGGDVYNRLGELVGSLGHLGVICLVPYEASFVEPRSFPLPFGPRLPPDA